MYADFFSTQKLHHYEHSRSTEEVSPQILLRLLVSGVRYRLVSVSIPLNATAMKKNEQFEYYSEDEYGMEPEQSDRSSRIIPWCAAAALTWLLFFLWQCTQPAPV